MLSLGFRIVAVFNLRIFALGHNLEIGKTLYVR